MMYIFNSITAHNMKKAGKRCVCLLSVCSLGTLLLSGCGSKYQLAYTQMASESNYSFLSSSNPSAETARPFAADLCVADADVEGTVPIDTSDVSAAAVFDLNNKNVLYAKNIFTKLYPASMTKVMTALVALKHSSADTVLTASSNVLMSDPDAQVCGLKPGDTMTLDQALHILLIYSANDVAVMIAENIGGSMENFIQMMNDEAISIGATNTNFINSNGLSDENHYTTAYDMYLIFNEAIQYDLFKEIINMTSYSTVYHDQSGADKEVNLVSTNYYLIGEVNAPSNITVIGGKTGTTNAAGHCLIMLSRDTSGNPYISIVMRAGTKDSLYTVMNSLLTEVPQ